MNRLKLIQINTRFFLETKKGVIFMEKSIQINTNQYMVILTEKEIGRKYDEISIYKVLVKKISRFLGKFWAQKKE